MHRLFLLLIACLIGPAYFFAQAHHSLYAQNAFAQNAEQRLVLSATSVLRESIQRPGGRIPERLLSQSHGVAIIPNVIKGGFVVGAKHGRGLLFIREPNGVWRAPTFISLTGGNIGWQVGLQSSDLILVFKTPRSVQGILYGKLTLGADIAAAAGPVGRNAAASTDENLRAEIYTYSRSRGLFAGVSVDGSSLRIDQAATARYYKQSPQNPTGFVPNEASELTMMVASYATATTTETRLPPPDPSDRSDQISITVADLQAQSKSLLVLLEPAWQEFLKLPDLTQIGTDPSSKVAIEKTIGRYQQVTRDPQYSALTSRKDFQTVLKLLEQLRTGLTTEATTLQLPSPPNR